MKILVIALITTFTGAVGSIVGQTEQNKRSEAKIQSLSAAVSALSKPPKKAKTEFQKKESEPHQHQYDDLKCSLCGHVLDDGRKIYLDKKVKELEINSKKDLDKCNKDLELEKSRLAIERKKKAKHDTLIKHDTTKIKEIKVIEKITGMKKRERGAKDEY